MKSEKNKCVGVAYSVNVPETAEEYDKLAGKQGACVESANKNVVYRSTNAQFRNLFAAAVEEDTGIERETDTIGTKTVTDEDGNETEEDIIGYTETEKVYLDRVYAELGLETEEEKLARFGDIIAAIEPKLTFDPSERAPASGKPRKARKEFRDAAAMIAEKAGPEGLERAAAKLGEELGFEVEATEDAVALAIQTRETRRKEQSLDELF